MGVSNIIHNFFMIHLFTECLFSVILVLSARTFKSQLGSFSPDISLSLYIIYISRSLVINEIEHPYVIAITLGKLVSTRQCPCLLSNKEMCQVATTYAPKTGNMLH